MAGEPTSALFIEPTVVLSGRFCRWIEAQGDFRRLVLSTRGIDAEATNVLHAIRLAGLAWANIAATSEPGSKEDGAEEVARSSSVMTTKQAADSLHISDRAVRAACAARRLMADRLDARWRISQAALDDYRKGCNR